MFRGQISLLTSLEITVISMLVVFAILAVLSFVLSLFKYIPAEEIKSENIKKNTLEKVERKRFNPEDIKDEQMRVAMMVATIEAVGEEKDATVRVVGIKELN